MNNELYLYENVTSEQLEALKDEVRDFVVLGTWDIKNNNLNFDEEGKVNVEKGTLLHGTKYEDKDTEKIESIAVNGLITSEFFGLVESASTQYHIEYYKANKDMTLKDFLTDEREFFPKEDNEMIGFLIIPGSDLTEVLKNDSLEEGSNVTDEIRSLILEGLTYHKEEIENENIAAIPIGMPVNCFSAIVVSGKIRNQKNKINKLHELFNKCYILTIDGEVLEKPVD